MLHLARATANLGLDKIAIGHLELRMVRLLAILAQGTTTLGHLEKNSGASPIADVGACPHRMLVDVVMWTETTKDIDRPHMVAGAEAGAEVLNEGIARLPSEPHQAKRSSWKGYHWTF